MFSDRTTGEKDIPYYEQAIEEYKRNRRIWTASNYEYSLKSLIEFQGKDKLKFNTITVQRLRDFENHLVEKKKLSKTTVGMYLRPLIIIENNPDLCKDSGFKDIYRYESIKIKTCVIFFVLSLELPSESNNDLSFDFNF